ncbi:MAG TPA: SUF system NifU family Fe-S cluster assembly protein [Kofleriaceae bacterium]|nr:SUF system NifU family Fe-S cluster assembly protein [Kofleriaceae bacterium]
MDDLYQATIVDHDRAPRNAGHLAAPTHHATVDNPLCGDVVTVEATIVDGAITEIAHNGRGCALSRAAASLMTTMVRGRTILDAQHLAAAFEHCIQSPPDAAIADELGDLRAFAGVRRFRSRRVCAALPFRALIQALDADT